MSKKPHVPAEHHYDSTTPLPSTSTNKPPAKTDDELLAEMQAEEDAKAKALAAVKTHVTMKRNPAHYDAPHTANVHVDEVDNWAKHGWEYAD